MNLFDAVKPECIETKLPSLSKEDALARLAALAARSRALQAVGEETILQQLAAREEVGTTGFGDGVAIPHCRLPEVEEFVVGLATCPDGAAFETLDGQPVRFFVVIVAPERQSDEHIRILSAVSQVLRVPGALEGFLAEDSPEALRESFLRYARDETETRPDEDRNLFHAIVQDEDLFGEILEAFAAFESVSTVVLEARESRQYLMRTPLFASFLGADEEQAFNNVIVAVVPRNLTNEMIRRVEQVTGPLAECDRVLLTVQELFYSAGRIRP